MHSTRNMTVGFCEFEHPTPAEIESVEGQDIRLGKAWTCHLQERKEQPEILADPIGAAKLIKWHDCESV